MATRVNVETNLKAAQMIDVLRSHPGEIMNSKSITSELSHRGIDILPNTVSNYLSVMIKQGDYPQLTSQPRVGFVWNADEAEFYAKKATEKTETSSTYRKKSTVMRNSEGYSDPTAGAAIKNTEGEDPYARLGEVWTTKGPNGNVEYFMIFSDWGAVKMGIPLYNADFRSRVRIKVDVGGATLYGDGTNFRSKPSKYFDTYMANVEHNKCLEALDKVFSAIADPTMSPVVVEKIAPANTIEVDGTLYTEADIRSKLDTIGILQSDLEATEKECEERREEVKCTVEDLAKASAKVKELNDVINSLRTALTTARKNTPVTIQVDGEIYNEEDITAIIRARNTVRVGDKIYKASDICELLDGRKSEDSAPVPDKAYVDKVVAMATIYKQFFDAYCQGMAKGETE